MNVIWNNLPTTSSLGNLSFSGYIKLEEPSGLAQVELTRVDGETVRDFFKPNVVPVGFQSNPVYEFNRLIVPPSHRRRGIGKIIVDALIQRANELRLNIFLTALAAYGQPWQNGLSQSELEAFYERRKFVLLYRGSHKFWYQSEVP